MVGVGAGARRPRPRLREDFGSRPGGGGGQVALPLARLREEFDAVCLAIGAQAPRELAVPGRGLDGVCLAMDYLRAENQRQAGRAVADGGALDARGRRVLVLGGGDTGADCVATAHRQGAREVVQVSINPRPPELRPPDNPWPERPRTYRRSYAIEEGGREDFSLESSAFLDLDGDGRVDQVEFERVRWTYDAQGRRQARSVLERGLRMEAELVLIAIGFAGAEAAALGEPALATTRRGMLAVDADMMTALPGVFAAGDACRGPSLVVWAIGEGRDAARAIDRYLTGASALPASLRSANPPLGF
jgi:YD repeat-containing protein